MGKIVKTTYLCDRCGNEIPYEVAVRKVSIYIQSEVTCGSYYDDGKILCAHCAEKLENLYEDFWNK